MKTLFLSFIVTLALLVAGFLAILIVLAIDGKYGVVGSIVAIFLCLWALVHTVVWVNK